MARIELAKLLYQEPQPVTEIEKLTRIYNCKDELPTENGEYLVYHMIYGYCAYGYTLKDTWGEDNKVTRKDGSTYNKITHWGKLDFLSTT